MSWTVKQELQKLEAELGDSPIAKGIFGTALKNLVEKSLLTALQQARIAVLHCDSQDLAACMKAEQRIAWLRNGPDYQERSRRASPNVEPGSECICGTLAMGDPSVGDGNGHTNDNCPWFESGAY